MTTDMLTLDNIESLSDFIPGDIAENIGRTTYYGLAVNEGDGDAQAAVIWRLVDYEVDSKPTTAYLSYLKAADPDSAKMLFADYGVMMDLAGTMKSIAELSKEDEKLPDMLEDARFEVSEQESRDITVTVGELAGLEVAKKSKIPSHLKPLNTLEKRTFRRGLMNCVVHSKRKLLDDLTELPMDWFEPDISCYVEADGRMNGFLLIHRMPSGRLRVESMCAVGPDFRKDLMYMIRFAIREGAALYPEDTEVILPRRDESAGKLTGFFFPDTEGEMCIYGERNENG